MMRRCDFLTEPLWMFEEATLGVRETGEMGWTRIGLSRIE
jgi:hypothetical protein